MEWREIRTPEHLEAFEGWFRSLDELQKEVIRLEMAKYLGEQRELEDCQKDRMRRLQRNPVFTKRKRKPARKS